MENTRSKGSRLVPYDPKLRKTIHKMVNAQRLEAHRLRFGLEAATVARGIQPNVVNNQPRAVDENIAMDGIIPPHHQPIATGEKVLPALPTCAKFTITCTMVQLLDLKGEATNWLNEIPVESIRTWTELKEAFLEQFFPESKELHMKDEITSHKAWYTRDAEVGDLRYEVYDIDLDEESNYLGNQGGFQSYNSGNQGNDSGNIGTKHEQVLEQAGREEDEAEQVDDLEDAQPIAKSA
ncbi:hypothetical protein KY284_020324 [Solanum tuberosum]|nr:hypothetical protein KY284_020324 [Solanum tuberosum]